jgi:DNA invertase Pin-like site-specific DNA recombinase
MSGSIAGITWIKTADGAIERWLQPKLNPAWDELNIANLAMFRGASVFSFRGPLDNQTYYRFTSLICFDWISEVEGHLAWRWPLEDLNDQAQAAAAEIPLSWFFVIQHNPAPSHPTFLMQASSFFDQRILPSVRRDRSCVVFANTATDLQNERSIEDQITLCRGYTSREGMNVVEVYEDRARSGGSVMGRGGLLRLLDQARERSFDVVVVEALDRLSRDMEDLAGIHKRLSFLGIEIRAVHEGVVNTVLVGLRELVGQLYREDNAHKVRRGLAGRVGQGLNAGGRAYGYVPAVGDKGKRVIVEAEA